MITVVPWHPLDNVFCRSEAVLVSTLAVHSSKQSTCVIKEAVVLRFPSYFEDKILKSIGHGFESL